MLYNQRKEINRRIQELEQFLFNDDESTDSTEYEKIGKTFFVLIHNRI